MRERRVKNAVLLPVLLAVILSGLFLGIRGAKADMGPKPSITLVAYNLPEDCYVALLGYTGDSESHVNFRSDTVSDKDVEKFLKEYCVDGWSMYESPTGGNVFHATGGRTTFMFGYMVPDPFRVIVVCPDLTCRVSKTLDQENFNTTCTYDYATGELRELYHDGKESGGGTSRVSPWYVLFCLLFTLIVELVLFKGFRFPFTRRNLISFFAINVITNLTYAWFTVRSLSSGDVVLRCFLFEVGIALTEAIFYIFALRDDHGDQCPEESFTYGITANVVSAVAGVVLLLIYYAVRRLLLFG